MWTCLFVCVCVYMLVRIKVNLGLDKTMTETKRNITAKMEIEKQMGWGGRFSTATAFISTGCHSSLGIVLDA